MSMGVSVEGGADPAHGKLSVSLNPEQQRVLDHRDNLCLSAGAGSGKTRTLVEKYIQLLIEYDRMPAEILAITFTEKAAAEMQVRIRKQLRERISAVDDDPAGVGDAGTGGAGGADPDQCRRLEEQLMTLGGGWISTIHSLGARILREHPAEAGIDPGFEMLPEQESDMLWESAAMAGIVEQAERDMRVGELSLRLGLGAGGRGRSLTDVLLSIKSQLESMGRRPEDLEPPDGGGRVDPADLSRALRQICDVPGPGLTLQKKIPVWEAVVHRLAEPNLTPERVLRTLAAAGWDETLGRLKPGGPLKKSEKELYQWVESAGSALAESAAGDLERDHVSTLMRLLSAMWRRAEQEKGRRRVLDFADLEIKTLDLLERHPEISASYQERFKHILVDEYQDVNIVQARIIRALAGVGDAGTGGRGAADPAGERPHALFAVGDPKQSIYRFRGADVEQFQRLWKDMADRQAAFELKKNYRSHPKLVDAVNAFFDGHVFQGNPPVEMEAALAARGAADPAGVGDASTWGRGAADPAGVGDAGTWGRGAADPAGVGDAGTWGRGAADPAGVGDAGTWGRGAADPARIQWLSFDLPAGGAVGRRELEAGILAERIRQIVETVLAPDARDLRQSDSAGPGAGLDYGDFALLFRATSSLYLYEEAMRRAQVPYELVKAGTAYQSQEVLDLINTLSVLVDPSDMIGWLGFLRSPLAGLSDDGIWQLGESGDIRRYFSADVDLPGTLSVRDHAAAEMTRSFLNQGRTERRRRTPLSFLDWILSASGYGALIEALSQPDSRRRSIETLRRAAAQYRTHRPDPMMAFLQAARRMVDRRERETGSDATSGSRVKLMTIHQSKGLEFPVVILPDLLRPESPHPPDVFVTNQDRGRSSLAVRIKLSGLVEKFPTPRWTAASAESERRETEEQKRLLYVAMTRAQDRLILAGPDHDVKGRTVWELLYQFLKAEPRHVEVVSVGPRGPAGVRDAGTGGAGGADPAGVRDAGIWGARGADPTAEMSAPALMDQRLKETRLVTHSSLPILPGVRLLNATSLPEEKSSMPGPGGRGRKYAIVLGILAHETLQYVPWDVSRDEQVGWVKQNLSRRRDWAGLPEKPLRQLNEDLGRFLASPLAERMRARSDLIRHEYPFKCFWREANGWERWYIQGQVDLLILGEIEIYDYKYERPKSDFGRYQSQLMAYAFAACRALGRPEVTVGLQFLMGNQALVRRKVTEKSAADYLSRLDLSRRA